MNILIMNTKAEGTKIPTIRVAVPVVLTVRAWVNVLYY